MITQDQMLLLLERLLPKTQSGELDWKEAPKEKNCYFLTLGEGVVSLAANKRFFTLSIFNQSGVGIATFRFRGEHLDVGSERVKKLYFAARATALGAGEIFDSMIEALDAKVAHTVVVGRIGAHWPDLMSPDPAVDHDDVHDGFGVDESLDPRIEDDE